jgi:hypothetical protein
MGADAAGRATEKRTDRIMAEKSMAVDKWNEKKRHRIY